MAYASAEHGRERARELYAINPEPKLRRANERYANLRPYRQQRKQEDRLDALLVGPFAVESSWRRTEEQAYRIWGPPPIGYGLAGEEVRILRSAFAGIGGLMMHLQKTMPGSGFQGQKLDLQS